MSVLFVGYQIIFYKMYNYKNPLRKVLSLTSQTVGFCEVHREKTFKPLTGGDYKPRPGREGQK